MSGVCVSEIYQSNRLHLSMETEDFAKRLLPTGMCVVWQRVIENCEEYLVLH